jgi:hypothetical protein
MNKTFIVVIVLAKQLVSYVYYVMNDILIEIHIVTMLCYIVGMFVYLKTTFLMS